MMEDIPEETLEKMRDAARDARGNAFVHEGRTSMGAAVLTDDGEIFQGCNTQSVISGMGSCAERNAMDNALSHGEYCFRAILILSGKEMPPNPCGMCLQYMAELSDVSGHDIQLIMVGADGTTERDQARNRLTETYSLEDSGKDMSSYEC
ncbi:MAG: cytidine deaminase [Candidatus Nanohaloarchaea archaeon]|nr:cytidine deaminase [Candidatus Nanohaloarchaea archaeon]